MFHASEPPQTARATHRFPTMIAEPITGCNMEDFSTIAAD
jgi:hypothetical protein